MDDGCQVPTVVSDGVYLDLYAPSQFGRLRRSAGEEVGVPVTEEKGLVNHGLHEAWFYRCTRCDVDGEGAS